MSMTSMPCDYSITSISVLGLAKKNDGKDHTLEVTRARPEVPSFPRGPVYYDPDDPATHHFIVDSEEDADIDWGAYKPSTGTAEPVRAEVPSSQGPGIRLELRIGKRMHAGRYTWVYDVHVISPRIDIPPLVAKIARQRSGRRLSVEAGAYEVLQSLQGAILPRCYGYFRGFVNLQETIVVPWNPRCKLPRSAEDLDIYDMPNASASLNILLLEKLGRPLSMFRAGDVAPGLQAELVTMWMAASDLGIIHHGIGASDILEASFDATRSLGTAQDTPHLSRWRLIDWEDFDISYGYSRQGRVHDFESRAEHLIENELIELQLEMETGEQDSEDEWELEVDSEDSCDVDTIDDADD